MESKYSKYVYNVTEEKAQEWSYFPFHQGKIINALTYSKRQMPDAPHWFHVGLIYGSDIGYGLCESPSYVMVESGPKMEVGAARPHKHLWDETFWWMGTDPQNPFDLGGDVEFWIGEGKDAEKFEFNKTTVIWVPANTIHNPHFFRNVKRPIIMCALINAPFAGVIGDAPPPPNIDRKILQISGYLDTEEGKAWLASVEKEKKT